jgi:predicted dehydrogenase
VTTSNVVTNNALDAREPRVRVGVIGYGYWGPNLVRNLHEMSDAELVGVAEAQPDRLQRVRRLYPHIGHFASHQELLAADLDAVVIATPIHTHYELAREALIAGKHTLVEKPLATRVDEVRALLQLGERQRRVVMAGHTFLYNPAVHELRRIVQSGELGQVYYADAARLSLGLFQPRANVFWDLVPHDLSILMYVLERLPVAVSARARSCVQPGVHDVGYLEVLFEGGVAAQIHVSWLDPDKVRRVTLAGDRCMVVYDDLAPVEKIRIYDSGVETVPTDDPKGVPLSYRRGQITIPHIAWREPLRLECEHFVECILSGRPPLSDALQAWIVVATLEAAERSLAEGGATMPVLLEGPDFQPLVESHAAEVDPNGHHNGHGAGGPARRQAGVNR